jgi:hypothetical protein
VRERSGAGIHEGARVDFMRYQFMLEEWCGDLRLAVGVEARHACDLIACLSSGSSLTVTTMNSAPTIVERCPREAKWCCNRYDARVFDQHFVFDA